MAGKNRLLIITMLTVLLLTVSTASATTAGEWQGKVNVHISIMAASQGITDTHRGSSHTGTELTIRYSTNEQHSPDEPIQQAPQENFTPNTPIIEGQGDLPEPTFSWWILWPLLAVLAAYGVYRRYSSKKMNEEEEGE